MFMSIAFALMKNNQDHHTFGCLDIYKPIQAPRGLSGFSGVIYGYNRRSLALETSQFSTRMNRPVLRKEPMTVISTIFG